MKRKKIMWVVTWEGTKPPPKQLSNLVICLHPNTKDLTVGELLEKIFMVAIGSDEEKKLAAWRGKLPPFFQYRVTKEHSVVCGTNPHLIARRMEF